MITSACSRRLAFILAIGLAVLMTGCAATVPMASKERDAAAKSFAQAPPDKANLYIYRNSTFGFALRKFVSIDGKPVGATAAKTYLFKQIEPGKRILSTESEFSDNTLELDALPGKTYFVRQYIKMGVFKGGANLELVPEEVARPEVLECERAEVLTPTEG